MGLSKAEASLFGALGFGGKGPTGGKNDPLNVVIANFAGTSASANSVIKGAGDVAKTAVGGMGGVGSFLSSAIGMLPALASGGALDSGTMALVGEKGPELFMPKTSGTIIPNNKLSSMGGDTHNWNIHAPGATSATIDDMKRMLVQAAPHIVKLSVGATKEQRMRLPQTAR